MTDYRRWRNLIGKRDPRIFHDPNSNLELNKNLNL